MRLLIKLVVILVLCAVEFAAYIAIAVLLGWEKGGGVGPMTILMAVWGATFHYILRWGGATKKPISEENQNTIENKS